jgi:hypothetical protein
LGVSGKYWDGNGASDWDRNDANADIMMFNLLVVKLTVDMVACNLDVHVISMVMVDRGDASGSLVVLCDSDGENGGLAHDGGDSNCDRLIFVHWFWKISLSFFSLFTLVCYECY